MHAPRLAPEKVECPAPPVLNDLSGADVSPGFLADLTLRHVGQLAEPTTAAVAEKLHLPRLLAEELLQGLYRERLIEVKVQSSLGASRYAMLDRGWERLGRAQSLCGYAGPAPVSLRDYARMTRRQAAPPQPASMGDVRHAFRDLVLPESLLQTLGCVVNSRRSLFITGAPGTGKTAVAERVNACLRGTIWIPHAVEVDGQVIRVFDPHVHRPAPTPELARDEYDGRWVCVERPLIMAGGELTLGNADLVWGDAARFYEAPFQVKANGGTLVIDDLGRQRVAPRDLLNRWILPLERRVDFLTLHSGKKIEVPFEALVVFSTNLNERELVDEAFLRRMGYRASLEPPTPDAYAEIFLRAARARGVRVTQSCVAHVLNRYEIEGRALKACEPGDLLDRMTDVCRFDGRAPECTADLVDLAWRNYFGTTHGFAPAPGGDAAHGGGYAHASV